MRFLYRFGIFVYGILLGMASIFNKKAASLIHGRKNTLKRLKTLKNQGFKAQKSIWFHFSSLGEFEQGRTVLEYFTRSRPELKRFITFYSPSGFQIQHDTNLANEVLYLLSDHPKHAKLIFDAFNPEIVVFTKYDYWYFYFKECAARNIPIYMISAIFRPNQIYFKPYGRFFKSILKKVTHFFVQNESSLQLLQSIGLVNASLTGDTRFDRVVGLPKLQTIDLVEIEVFLNGQKTVVAGSTWLPDERKLALVLAERPDWKCILVPHEVSSSRIQEIFNLFPKAILFSSLKTSKKTMNEPLIKQSQVLIIDSVGLLSFLYRYGSAAYIGGGFGNGIHNILEAATYGLPVIFGPNFQKFQEARDLIALKSATSYQDTETLSNWLSYIDNLNIRKNIGKTAKNYIKNSSGATSKIIKKIENNQLSQK